MAEMAEPASAKQDKGQAASSNKPQIALFAATACGLGYLPKAPGTFGSLGGVLIYALIQFYLPLGVVAAKHPQGSTLELQVLRAIETSLPVAAVIAALGVWSSNVVSKYMKKKDPQIAVIDEVSGQHLTYFAGLAPLNWKYLIAGFILFRVFDIWKPFPARQAESLPGGWGIMADDWVAGIYAAVVLIVLRHLGL